MKRGPLPTALLLLAVGLGLGAALVVLYAPLQTSTAVSIGPGGTTTRTTTSTLLESEGPGVAFPALAPVVVLLVPAVAFAARARRPFLISAGVACALLAVFVVLTGFSIGLFYVPALIALTAALAVVAAAVQRPTDL